MSDAHKIVLIGVQGDGHRFRCAIDAPGGVRRYGPWRDTLKEAESECKDALVSLRNVLQEKLISVHHTNGRPN